MEKLKRLLLLFIVLNYVQQQTGQKTCGRALQSAPLQGKIVGGYEVGYYKYPWFASLQLDGTAWCGGTLIGPGIVASAAHCFKDYLKQNDPNLEAVFTVKLGVNNNCVHEKTQKMYKVKKVYVHEKYLKNDPYYDICLLILEGDTSAYEPVCLPPKALDDNTRGREGYIIGLGTLKFGSTKYPCKLNEGRILIYKDQTCKDMITHASQDKEDYLFVNAFCAGYVKGGIDACQGDSGGPVLYMSPDGYYAILGVTSFGYECAKKNLMGIYTDVSHYLDWIKEKTGLTSMLTTNGTMSTTTTTTTTTRTVTIMDSPKPQTSEEIAQPTTSLMQQQEQPPTVYLPDNFETMWPPKRIIIEFKKRRYNHRRYWHHRKKKQGLYNRAIRDNEK